MVKPRLNSTRDLQSHDVIDDAQAGDIERVAARYAVGITAHVMRTMTGTPKNDPIARQYVPQLKELAFLPHERPDPIGDHTHTPVRGIVHRYADRVLYKIAHVCAVYCRFCFRREMVGPDSQPLSPADRQAALAYIRDNEDIWEVIMTGGDPLVLSARQLATAIDDLTAIEHVQVIRIHTRVPVADPARITPGLCDALRREKAVYVSVHINHARELTPEVMAAFRRLQDAGCVLVSQSVLLKGVNDDPTVLEDLFRRLTALRVRPYYLHHPDLSPGTAHFRPSLARGQDIVKKLFARLSGIARPQYVLDIPGGHGKIPAHACYLRELENGGWEVEDPQGQKHLYVQDGDQ